jgi:hypothetical protein
MLVVLKPFCVREDDYESGENHNNESQKKGRDTYKK